MNSTSFHSNTTTILNFSEEFFYQFLWRMFGGGISGVVQTLLMYPLILHYTRNSMIENSKKSAWEMGKEIYLKSGIKGFYDGALFAIVCSFFWRSCSFSVYQACLYHIGMIFSAFVTSFAEALVLNPFNFLRVQFIEKKIRAEENNLEEPSMRRVIVETIRKNFFGLWEWKSVLFFTFRQFIFNLTKFYIYGLIGEFLVFYFFINDSLSKPISAFLGGSIGIVLSNWIDVLRIRVQQSSGKSLNELFKIGGLFNGIIIKILKKGAGTAIIFFVYNFFDNI